MGPLAVRPLTWLRIAPPDAMVHGRDVAELFGRRAANFTTRLREQYPDFPAARPTVRRSTGTIFRGFSVDRPPPRGYRVGDLREWIAKHDFPTQPSKESA